MMGQCETCRWWGEDTFDGIVDTTKRMGFCHQDWESENANADDPTGPLMMAVYLPESSPAIVVTSHDAGCVLWDGGPRDWTPRKTKMVNGYGDIWDDEKKESIFDPENHKIKEVVAEEDRAVSIVISFDENGRMAWKMKDK